MLLRILIALPVVVASARVSLEHNFAQGNARWTQLVERPAPDAKLSLHLMMRHEARDVGRLEETLMAVSDPDSVRYGAYLTLAELNAMMPISRAKHDAVAIFLRAAPEAEVSTNINGDIYEVTLTVQSVERLFQTTVAAFKHETGAALLRASTPHTVSHELAAAVAYVGDLSSLPRVDAPIGAAPPTDKPTDRPTIRPYPPSSSPISSWPQGPCGDSLCSANLATSYTLKSQYSVPADGGLGAKYNNSMAVAEYQGQGYSQKDLDMFNKGCQTTIAVAHNVGGLAGDGEEAELDIEYIAALAEDIPLTVVYSADYSLINWIKQITSMEDSPLVHSVSYGNDEKQQASSAYIYSCNSQFMAAGARGLSVLFASGDQGVCGREGCGVIFDRFKPDFPADSPYITAVGGTDFVTPGSVGDEKAWSAGGGGFSDYFPIPDWQAKEVAAYKANKDAKLPPQSLWNNTGRGYPDIAALGGGGNPYCVVSQGSVSGVYGTSAACPTAASIFARVNGERLKAGKPALGWLNPFIYKNPGAFNDVTTGYNGCSCDIFWTDGFQATAGWDPTTGLGTPDYLKILAAAMK